MPLVLRISLALSSKFMFIHLLAIIISQGVAKGGGKMKRDKPVLKVEAEMQNIEQVKELLPQIATLQEKNDVVLKIQVNPGVITKINQF